MAHKLITQASRFMEMTDSLHAQGIKKKDIAQHLGLYPSAYSTLTNLVFKQLSSWDPREETETTAIENAFSQANNISEKRIRREMEGYLQKLEQLDQSPHNKWRIPRKILSIVW